MNTKAIYTINFAGYDLLRQPSVITDGWDYIVFTDREQDFGVWQPKYIESGMEGRYAARYAYINSQKFMSEYPFTIMVGGQLRVDGDMNEFVKKYYNDSVINILKHPCRDCIYQEAKVVRQLGLDKKEVIERHMQRYRSENFPEHYGLSACGIIGRKRDDKLARFERLWWDEVRRGCYRDQLSFDYVRWKLKWQSINWIPYDVMFGKYFSVYKRKTMERIGGI